MKIVITGVSGNVGRAVAANLANKGHELKLLVRDNRKLPATLKGVGEVLEGDHLDAQWVRRAVSGADALFWMTPMAMTNDIAAYNHKASEAANAAAREARRVVALSGAYCDQAGLGLASWIRFLEFAIEAGAANVRHLRAGLFMENFLFQKALITTEGIITQPVPAEARVRFVATSDIGRAAAQLLEDTTWSGHGAVGIHGPERLSFAEAAAQLGRTLGREVRFVESTGADMEAALVATGAPAEFARNYVEMYLGFARLFQANQDPKDPTLIGSTTLASYCQSTLGPALQA